MDDVNFTAFPNNLFVLILYQKEERVTLLNLFSFMRDVNISPPS